MDVLDALKQQLSQQSPNTPGNNPWAQGQQQPPQAPQAAGNPWAQPAQPVGIEGLTGVNIPVKLNVNGASIRVYLEFDPKYGQSPEALTGLIQRLGAMGLPLDIWQPSQGWNGNNSGGYRRRWN